MQWFLLCWGGWRTLTRHHGPGDVSFLVVGQQDQLRDEEGVVGPDSTHQTDAEPAHRVHHEVQARPHGFCRTGREPLVTGPEMAVGQVNAPDADPVGDSGS